MKKIILFLSLILLLFSCKSGKKTATSSSTKNNSNKEKKTQTPEAKKADVVIKTARNFIGTPYLFGGTSRAGMDCSGLAILAFKEVGINLPRTSNEQSTFGKTVSLSEIKKGDLVFFSDKKGQKKITHVGIITEVKGPDDAKFIHASTKLGVVENDLFVSYYKSLIIKVVRVL